MEKAKEECKANSVKAQFRTQKLKERLQIKPLPSPQSKKSSRQKSSEKEKSKPNIEHSGESKLKKKNYIGICTGREIAKTGLKMYKNS